MPQFREDTNENGRGRGSAMDPNPAHTRRPVIVHTSSRVSSILALFFPWPGALVAAPVEGVID